MSWYETGPSPIGEDNKVAIVMVNQHRPMTRTQHIYTQWFAIQEWKQLGDIYLTYVKTGDNPSDALTKVLGTVLHHRHCAKAMGLYGSRYAGNLK